MTIFSCKKLRHMIPFHPEFPKMLVFREISLLCVDKIVLRRSVFGGGLLVYAKDKSL